MGELHPHTRFLIGEIKDLLIRQLQDVNAIDTKASILLGADALIMTAGIAALSGFPEIRGRDGVIFIILVIASYLTLFASLSLALLAYRVTVYKDSINPQGAYEEWFGVQDEKKVLSEYLQTLIVSYEENRKIIDRKTEKINQAVYCLWCAVALSMGAAFVYFLCS